ncbi:MAG: glycosyltransferase family 2 protein [Rhodoferax sp.]|nr:glycosyltransferase family 2 protein [Rhodoferax sp.]
MKICTLVPAYKTGYLKDLLRGLRSQTVPSNCIIFSDDSPNGAFATLLFSDAFKPYRDGLPIELVRGPRKGAFSNFQHLIRQWDGSSELFHIHLDDDLVYPEFYEKHLIAHASGDFSCSVSKRWEADEDGQPVRGQNPPLAVSSSSQRMLSLDAGVVFQTTVAECKNWFGEFSNAVFRTSCADLVLRPELAGVSFAGLWDLGAFAAASVEKPLCYIQEGLGFFRKGPDQNSAQTYGPIMKAAIMAYVALALSGRRLNKVSVEQSLSVFRTISSVADQWYFAQEDLQPMRALLPRMAAQEAGAEALFLVEWRRFLDHHGY